MKKNYYLSFFLDPTLIEQIDKKHISINDVDILMPLDILDVPSSITIHTYDDVAYTLNNQMKEFIQQQNKIDELHMDFEELGTVDFLEMFDSEEYVKIYNKIDLSKFNILKIWKLSLVLSDFIANNCEVILKHTDSVEEKFIPAIKNSYEITKKYFINWIFEAAAKRPTQKEMTTINALKLLNEKDNKIFQLRLLFTLNNQKAVLSPIVSSINELHILFNKDITDIDILKIAPEMEELLND